MDHGNIEIIIKCLILLGGKLGGKFGTIAKLGS